MAARVLVKYVGVMDRTISAITVVLALAGAALSQAQSDDTLVRNTGQAAGPDMTALKANQHGLFQGFRTGANANDRRLTDISLYVGDTHDSRFMTVDAGLYRGDRDDLRHARLTRVATLARSGFDDYAHNVWRAPEHTYLKPNAHYYIVLDCTAGCANDNRVQFGMTRSTAEDAGGESGWSIHDRLGFRRAGASKWKLDNNEALRIRVNGVPSGARAYEAEIISTPANGHTYRHGEHIDIFLKFNTHVSVFDESFIGIRVGDATDGSNYRAARIVAGSGHQWLRYRYQVRIDDVDATGISVDQGGPDTGLGGTLPTVVASFGAERVIRYYPGLADDPAHRVDGSFQVSGLAITSTPEHPAGYRFGDHIEITLTFTTEAYVQEDGSVIGIRVGDARDAASSRTASYVSGSGSKRLVYRYRVQPRDFDAHGISVDAGGPDSGFGGPLPTTSANLGARPVSRHYPGLPDDPDHRVALAVTASFADGAYTVSEAGTAATVTVRLGRDPEGPVVIPLTAAPANGATAADYALSATSLTFARGETAASFTVTAIDDRDDDDDEGVYLRFGALPAGVTDGSQTTAMVTIADDDGPATGHTVTVAADREAYSAGTDDVLFNLTLAEPAPQPVTVTVRLSQDQPFLDRADLERSITFAADATGATLTVAAERHDRAVSRDGTLTATVIAGAGYRIGTPAAAGVRMVAADPALIARLDRLQYRFEEGAATTAAAVQVVMETLPGVPAPNRGQTVTIASAGGTAEADVDFTSFTHDLTFAPDEFVADGGRWVARQTVGLPLIDDDEDEVEEHFSITLTRDQSLRGRVQVRRPDRMECAGACRSRIVIADDDQVGVTVLDADGNELTDLRVAVPEGERVTYQLKLDRRPATWVIVVRDRGSGDPDLVPVGERSWLYSPDEPREEAAATNVHHWQEPFPVTVEALQDDDDRHGERTIRHHLLSEDEGQKALPEVVVVEVDDEAQEVPDSVTLWSAELTVGSEEGVLGYVGEGTLSPDRWTEADAEHAVEQLSYAAARSEVVLRLSAQPARPSELTLHLGEEALPLAEADGEAAFTWSARELEWEEGGRVAVRLVRTPVDAQPALAVADASVREAAGAALAFLVSLSAPADGAVTVDYATADGTAVADEDYTPVSGTLTFAAGETVQTVAVAVLDDAHDEGEETLSLSLSNAAGARIEDGEATGTISNADALPRAWLARFGRTAAGHVLDAVADRLARAPAAARATIGGQPLHAHAGGPDAAGAPYDAHAPGAADVPFAVDAPAPAAYREPWGAQPPPDAVTLGLRDLVANSSFDLVAGSGAGPAAGDAGATGGRWTVWGRGAWSRFAGADGGLALDGDVVTGTVGVDHERGRVLGGLALAYSIGDGTFDGNGAVGADRALRSGALGSSLLSIHPYLRLALHERLAVWGMLGYGLAGELELAYRDRAPIRTDVGMLMGAVGLDAALLTAAHTGGLQLTTRVDGLFVRMNSAAAPGLAATEAQVSRGRLLLEASHPGVALLGGLLSPALHVGGRYDGGDAEQGAGLLIGGSLAYAVPAWGLTLTAGGHGLLAHQSAGFREWGAGGSLAFDPGAPGRGLALHVAPSWGAAGTDAAALWSLPDAAPLAAHVPAPPRPAARLDAELSYGLPVPDHGATAAPYAGLSQTEHGNRTWRLGARYHGAAATFSVQGLRTDHPATGATYALEMQCRVSY